MGSKLPQKYTSKQRILTQVAPGLKISRHLTYRIAILVQLMAILVLLISWLVMRWAWICLRMRSEDSRCWDITGLVLWGCAGGTRSRTAGLLWTTATLGGRQLLGFLFRDIYLWNIMHLPKGE